mgnify:CR=1 FL=1
MPTEIGQDTAGVYCVGVNTPLVQTNRKQDIRRFARSKERKESAFQRDSKYESANFKVNDFLEFLQGENVTMDFD